MGNYQRINDRITGKIVIRAKLTNETPLLIGKGSGVAANIDVIKMPNGQPYIPASSIAGALKRFMVERRVSELHNYIWGRTGKEEKNPLQSHFRIDDLVPESKHSLSDVVTRDGVRINHQTGTAEDQKKYDYQVVEPGLVFPFSAEITLRESMVLEEIRQFVANMKTALLHEAFRVGANTNTGFGKLSCEAFEVYFFEFPTHAEAWFEYIDSGKIEVPEMDLQPADSFSQRNNFSIEATFRLKSSMMIGSYGINGDEPDKSQLKSRDKFVLPGKSIRGAIRHRAAKILNTLNTSDAENQLNVLFGFVSEDEREQIKGRLRVEEYFFKEHEVEAMLQNRIRIDRFTGGVINGALFNSEPIWTKGEEAVKLTFSILKDALPAEKKLLLLLLKDLWLADLAIGGEKNVGRGVLLGQEASIYNDGELVAAISRSDDDNGIIFTHGSVEIINKLTKTQDETDEK